MKGCGKQFAFKREVNRLEQETEGEELFEETDFMVECKEPLLCQECKPKDDALSQEREQ